MRILHTSDWHIGAELEGNSRADEHRFFFDWLVRTIDAESVDVLVVAGDVFHHENPSSSAQELYYQTVMRLSSIPGLRRIVMVGGNHDSASRLDAPRELLGAFKVSVVGGWSSDERARTLIPVSDDSGEVALVVAAVPYVNGHRLGVSTFGKDADAIRAQTIEAFSGLYGGLRDDAERMWPGVPCVATGHLTCEGATEDDYQTAIHHVGTIAGMPGSIFGDGYAYVALGHIHRSYPIAGSTARYSGSPIGLRFTPSEMSARKVILVDVARDGETSVRSVEPPLARELVQFRGREEELLARLRSYRPAAPQGAFVHLVVHRDTPMADALQTFQTAALDGVRIVSVVFENPEAMKAELLSEQSVPSVQSLTPWNVFEYFFTQKNQRPPSEDERIAFDEAMQSVGQREDMERGLIAGGK